MAQAEDELAGYWHGLGGRLDGCKGDDGHQRPGISSMSEFAGMSYFAEIPAVDLEYPKDWNFKTGLPTRTGQCDITFAYYLGHGDTKNVLLFPSDLKECFEFGLTAF
ncbi:MAG: hypothetical protein R2865_05365 [Deinococcales bacterium]